MSKELRVDHLLLRGGTASEWTAANPVLLKNEMGIERQDDGTCKIKIGDGSTAWSDLPYYDSTPKEVSDIYVGLSAPTNGAKLWILSDVFPASGNGITVSNVKPENNSMIWIVN